MDSATTICSDKNKMTVVEMTVVEAYVGGKKVKVADNKSILSPKLVSLLIEGIAQNTTGKVFMPEDGKDCEVTGSPTEKAILLWGLNMGMNFDTARSSSSIVHTFPFNSEKKRGGAAVKLPGSEVHIHWKGAAEIVLTCCSNFMDENDQVLLMDKEKLLRFRKVIDDMDARRLRCVALAYREYQIDEIPNDEGELSRWQLPEGELILLAIAGIKVMAQIENVGVMARTQLGGSCGIHAMLGCIQECLRLNSVVCVPSLQDPTCCCKSNGNTEKGWSLHEVLTYILNHRLALESDYPFVGNHIACHRCKVHSGKNIIKPRIRITGFHHSRVFSANQLKTLLSEHGHPICVTLYVGDEFGDVDTPPETDKDGLFVKVYTGANKMRRIYGHAIMIVDYGMIKKRSFWLAMNSFGPKWGDKGKIKIDQDLTKYFANVGVPLGVELLPEEDPEDDSD